MSQVRGKERRGEERRGEEGRGGYWSDGSKRGRNLNGMGVARGVEAFKGNGEGRIGEMRWEGRWCKVISREVK